MCCIGSVNSGASLRPFGARSDGEDVSEAGCRCYDWMLVLDLVVDRVVSCAVAAWSFCTLNVIDADVSVYELGA